ncbi:hypothetical protein ACLMJK_007558 [Lecanora helva]
MNFLPISPTATDSNPNSRKDAKLRATCDACKDAKVRCNRDVPTCYRCRNQKLKCVYNPSQRMGRPRRTRGDQEPFGAGAANKQDKAQGKINGEKGARKDETCGNHVQEQRNRPSIIDATDNEGHCTGSSSNDVKTQNARSVSSLMEPFGSPSNFDPTQSQTPTGISDLDQMVDFDSFHDPSIPAASALSNQSQTSYWMKPQITPILDLALTREQSDSSRNVAKSLSDPSTDTVTDGNIMLTDGLEERPFPNFDTMFGSEQTQAYGNVSQEISSAVDKHNENTAASGQYATCECSQIILQKLSDFDENQLDIFSCSFDVILMLEQCVQGHITKVLECGICATKRPTMLLLLAIIIDNVVSMLETLSRFSSSSRSPVESSDRTPWAAPNSFRIPQVADMTGGGKTAASPTRTTATDKPPLLVGSHEILSEERDKFLKQLLQGRLSNLSATLRQLMLYMQRSSPQNSNSRHGSTMMAETYKRLQLIAGRVELWD